MPDVVLIDLSRLPSHGREIGIAIRGSKSTRHVPIIFSGGAAEKRELVRAQLPDAIYCDPEAVCEAVSHAGKSPVPNPVVPVQMMDRFAGRTVCQKLGIRDGNTVAVLDPPRGYEKVLAPLAAGLQFAEEMRDPAAVTLWFVRDRPALEASIGGYRALASSSKLWILWPKRKPGAKGGINETFIRETAISLGLVDYKVCSVDATWSAMLFAQKKVAR